MALPFIELQTALYQRLTNDTTLLSLLAIDEDEGYSGVYNYVTEGAPFPYIVISEPMLNLDREVKVEEIFEETIALHVWHNQATSGNYGNIIPYQIIEAIYNALRYKLALPSYEILQVIPREPKIFDDIDATLKHGVIMMKYKLLRIK